MRLLTITSFIMLTWFPGKAIAFDLTTKTIERVEHPGIELKIEYPHVDSSQNNTKVFNALVENITHDWPTNASYVAEEYRKLPWEQDKDELCEGKDVKDYGPDSYCQYFILTYEIHYKDSDRVSIEFYQYWYLGGAHGIEQSYPLNFDFSTTGKAIALSSFFKNGSKYLERLAHESNLRMEAPECLERKVRAEHEDFTIWFFSSDGLIFNWPTYWLGGYACGSREVTIPYSSLSDILKESTQSKIQ